MKRFLTIIFAIAIFVACNPNKRIVSTVPIKTKVLGVELCKQMTEDEIVDILEENSNISFLDYTEHENASTYIFGSYSEYHSIEYGGLVWDYVIISTSEESNVFSIQLQSVFESIETAKQQYDITTNLFSQKYGKFNSFEQGAFWTDDTNSVRVYYYKGKAMDGTDRYYCILDYVNIDIKDRIEADNQSDI